MISLILATHLLSLPSQPAQDKGQIDPNSARLFFEYTMPAQDNEKSQLHLIHYITPLQEPKTSPKKEWKFPYSSLGFVQPPTSDNLTVRFRVFAQTRNEGPEDVAHWTTRLFLRLWNYAYFRASLDHNLLFRRWVDVYLCQEGDPGGEQLFDVDTYELDDYDRPTRVNTIYIYQVQKIPNNFELCREIAHEYGHAILPTVGGYDKSAPESYANGDVGERIFMTWLRDDLKSGKILPDDAVFTPIPALDKYITEKVEPLVTEIATRGVDEKLLLDKTVKGYNEYVALSVYASQILPKEIFGRSQGLTAREAKDLEKGMLDAAEERENWTVNIPAYLKGKPIYIPLCNGKVSNAKVLSRKGKWAKIQPTAEPVTIKNPPLPPQ
ncbi:MAG: hypothetical protein KF836_07305 [Fimbriimonadaceae bacterium]|nr:hypothetical protein [Fimbriimonadaceae bacterium]